MCIGIFLLNLFVGGEGAYDNGNFLTFPSGADVRFNCRPTHMPPFNSKLIMHVSSSGDLTIKAIKLASKQGLRVSSNVRNGQSAIFNCW